MGSLWRFLSVISAVGLVLCYLSGFLSLSGISVPILFLGPTYGLFPLWFLLVLASCYYGRNYSAKEFQKRCLYLGPRWVTLAVKASFGALAVFFGCAVYNERTAPAGFALSLFYSVMLATFVALSPGGIIREGLPTPAAPIPSVPGRLRPWLLPLASLCAAIITIQFSAQVVSLYRPLDWKPWLGANTAIFFLLWIPACLLANQAARDQPSQNFWKAAAGRCPRPVQVLLIVQALTSMFLAWQSGQQDFLIMPFNQVSLAVYISRWFDEGYEVAAG